MRQRYANMLLGLVAFIWGATFTVIHEVVASVPALMLLTLRFGFAALALLPILRQQPVLDRRGLKISTLLGLFLFVGYAAQTFGLYYTTPARSGFITGLSVLIVPLLSFLLGQQPPLRTVVGIGFALIGLVIFSWGCFLPAFQCTDTQSSTAWLYLGDALTLGCALAFAIHIIAVGRWVPTLPVLPVNIIQMCVVAGLAALIAVLTGGIKLNLSWETWGSILFLGLIGTSFTYTLQLKLQQFTTPTHTALVFALEPVFATLCSWLWSNEVLTSALWTGGSLILLGVIISELPFDWLLIRNMPFRGRIKR